MKSQDSIVFEKIIDAGQVERTARIANAIWTEHYTPIIGPAQVRYMVDKFQSPKAITNHIASGWLYYILCVDGVDAGYFTLKPELDEKKVLLSKFYLEKTFRGRGLSRVMLDFIKELCSDMSADKLYLTVNKNNSNSIAAYHKLGFTNEASAVTDIGDGYVMDDYIFAMNI